MTLINLGFYAYMHIAAIAAIFIPSSLLKIRSRLSQLSLQRSFAVILVSFGTSFVVLLLRNSYSL